MVGKQGDANLGPQIDRPAFQLKQLIEFAK
jgi:hypothetical protein